MNLKKTKNLYLELAKSSFSKLNYLRSLTLLTQGFYKEDSYNP